MLATRPAPPRTSAAALAIALTGLAACHQEEPTTSPNSQVDNQNLIGGFTANDTRLDGSGSMVLMFPGGFTDLLCSAALLTPETVLTARHCAEAIGFAYALGAKVGFAVGPSSSYPRKVMEVVAFETAPGDGEGFVGYGRDVAVLHLDHPLADAPTVDVAGLSDEDLGNPFAAIGFGVQDNAGSYGTRRVGKQTLKGREGKVFEIMFGSFERFYEWFLTGQVDPAQFLTPPGRPTPPAEPPPPAPPPPPVPPPAPVPPDLEQIARQIYDGVVLEKDYEIVTGGTPGDAQPCFGDSGGSLIRKVDDRFVSYGVVSGGIGSTDLICDMGTVYAAFGPETLAFIDRAKQWEDPCGDMDSQGLCDGNVAKRCTNVAEGRRRVVDFDCGLLGMTCNTRSGQVSCDDNPIAPPPPAMPRPPREATPEVLKKVDKVFRATKGTRFQR
jgi:hypothetical protein